MNAFTPDKMDMVRVAGIINALCPESITYDGLPVSEYEDGFFECFGLVYEAMMEAATDGPEDEPPENIDYHEEYEKYYEAYLEHYKFPLYRRVLLYGAIGKYLQSLQYQLKSVHSLEAEKTGAFFGQIAMEVLYKTGTAFSMYESRMSDTWMSWPWPLPGEEEPEDEQ